MARFEPFAALRYNLAEGDSSIDDVAAPPYDVINPEQRAALAARSPYNAVHLELPEDLDGQDRYVRARAMFNQWQDEAILIQDPEPTFYVYRMGFHDDAGHARQTTGVFGALGLPQEDGVVLPHEETMSKPKDDRLNLLRACEANLSPIWGLSLSTGWSELCDTTGPPLAKATDADGVHHRLWPITQPAVAAAIKSAIESSPVVIADGHHRFETALAYQRENREQDTDAGGPYDFILAYIVELSEDQLCVKPTHRALSGLPSSFDILDFLESSFDINPDTESNDGIQLITSESTFLLRPPDESDDHLDSRYLDDVLQHLPDHELEYVNDGDGLNELVRNGKAQFGFLLRPAKVSQIAANAASGTVMPPKTTLFWPKIRTGFVFRRAK